MDFVKEFYILCTSCSQQDGINRSRQVITKQVFLNFFQKRLRRRHLDSSNDLTSTFASFLQINFTQSSGYSTKSPIEKYSLLIRQPFPSAICCLANSRLSSLSIDLELLVLGTTLVSYLSISELNCKKEKKLFPIFFYSFHFLKKCN